MVASAQSAATVSTTSRLKNANSLISVPPKADKIRVPPYHTFSGNANLLGEAVLFYRRQPASRRDSIHAKASFTRSGTTKGNTHIPSAAHRPMGPAARA